MKRMIDLIQQRPWVGWVLFLGTVAIVFGLSILASTIVERRTEAKFAYLPIKPLPDNEPRNEVWGESFPREYETFLKTADTTFKSKFGGGAELDYLEDSPALVVMWAGYPFSRDYKQSRGHFYAIDDIRTTLRTTAPLPATCWTCKSTDVPRLMEMNGIEEFYKGKWKDKGAEVVNAIGCQDCHDPKTMNLRITRPALVEAFEKMGKDINKASHQDMRSLVCAQCHVEYYFKGDGKYLTFPWEKGTGVEAIEAYYDSIAFSDWTHTLSKTPMIKAQHPDYELFQQGIHAQRGVSCADCHMPYKSEGAVKFTDHQIQSPLNNVSNSCQVCHRESEATLVKNVTDRQDKIRELRLISERLLATVHIEAKAAWDAGATEAEMKPALTFIRHAQWRWDYVGASNGLGFHAPQESARILGTAIDKAQEARLAIYRILAKHGKTDVVALPDLTTKAKAQAFIGLDMKKLEAEKAEFMKTVVPEWDKKAKEREAAYPKATPSTGTGN
ncbi:MAG: ammonia-forming cytochrome c nitrite reductase [Bacteroidetes bacterium]|nr:ammonia-forming cytochrome c nitrite reductase [Bacteroidota bacterium]